LGCKQIVTKSTTESIISIVTGAVPFLKGTLLYLMGPY